MTSRRYLSAAILVLSVALAGCRQADGPMPDPIGDVPNQLGDLSRDLASVSRGDQQARQDLSDDVRVFVDEDAADAEAAVAEFTRRTAEVIAGRPLTEQNAERIAHALWTVAAARELSSRQIETLQNDLHALLVSMGVSEDDAVNVAAQAGEVQALVTSRQKRWYEFY